MKQWICQVCGYTHQGENPPEVCPRCNAPKQQFRLKKKHGSCTAQLILTLVILATIIYVIFGCKSAVTVDNSVVKDLELSRFLGKWYEVARFDHKFERGMTQCVATYTMQDDGTIRVLNQGIKDGVMKTVEGKAKTTDSPALLRVSFFGPFYSDYRILMLDTDYSYALVGGSDDKYLWVLSRTPELNPIDRETIITEAIRRGYDTSKLIWN